MVSIKLLGGPAISSGGRTVSGRAAQPQRIALLSLLVCGGERGMTRDKLMAYLWPEVDAIRARHLLSNSLYVLRQTLGPGIVQTAGEVLRINTEVASSDVGEFLEALRQGDCDRAVSLYAGPFLDGFFLDAAAEFERWVDEERETLRRGCIDALERMALARESESDFQGAAQCWRRLASMEPYNGRVALRLMQALARTGDRAGAIRHGEEHVRRLRLEVMAAPDPEIGAFVVGLREGGIELPGVSRASEVTRPAPSVGLPPAEGRRLLAVLPLEGLGDDPGQAYFAEGMTDALITGLARLRDLRVISRTSVLRYKGTRQPLGEIARELGVDLILEGTVLREGDQVRVTTQLIRADTDEHLWAESFQRHGQRILDLQSEIARAVAREVGIQVRPSAPPQRAVSPDVYEDYFEGLYHAGQGDLAGSIAACGRAIDRDPEFAPAHSALARSLYFLGFFGFLPPTQAFGQMRESAERALALDPSNSEAHGLLALVRLHYDWRWAEAEQHFRRALELSPSNAQVRHDYAHYLLAMGRGEESVAESRRAVELDPFFPGLVACLGWHRLSDGHYDEAAEHSLRAVRMAPEFFWPHMTLGWVYEEKCLHFEAIAALRKAVGLSGSSAFATAALAHALARAGQEEEAARIAAELERRSEVEYVSAYEIAAVYAGLEDLDRVFQWLDRAVEERSGALVHLGWEPRLVIARSDPRFPGVVRRIGLPARPSFVSG